MLPEVDMGGSDKTERQNRAILRNVESAQRQGGLTSLIGSLVVPDAPESDKYGYFRDYHLNLEEVGSMLPNSLGRREDDSNFSCFWIQSPTQYPTANCRRGQS